MIKIFMDVISALLKWWRNVDLGSGGDYFVAQQWCDYCTNGWCFVDVILQKRFKGRATEVGDGVLYSEIYRYE